jgi:hypothetical protein
MGQSVSTMEKRPCFVGCSDKASITAEMLAEMLKLLDNNKVYN